MLIPIKFVTVNRKTCNPYPYTMDYGHTIFLRYYTSQNKVEEMCFLYRNNAFKKGIPKGTQWVFIISTST